MSRRVVSYSLGLFPTVAQEGLIARAAKREVTRSPPASRFCAPIAVASKPTVRSLGATIEEVADMVCPSRLHQAMAMGLPAIAAVGYRVPVRDGVAITILTAGMN